MSIQDSQRIGALEARLAELESKHDELAKLVAAYREAESTSVLESFPAGRAALKAKRG